MLMISLSTASVSAVVYVIYELYGRLRKNLTCSVTIQNNDDMYRIVLDYLTQKGFLKSSMT